MAEKCRNCGLELFVGQRFCRACGASTDELTSEAAPTQMMPPPPEEWAARNSANTAPTSRQDTSPVYNPSPGYQPMVPPAHPQMMPPYMPPQKRSRLGWVLAFIGSGLFVLVVIAVMMIARFSTRFRPNSGPVRQPPPVTQPGETALSEAADQVVKSGNETAFTKTFTLDDGAAFSIKNMNGSIAVSTWAEHKAEVTAYQKGSDLNAPVVFAGNSRGISIKIASGRGNDIRFEIKLPREMGRVEISSTNGSIKIADLTGQIAIAGQNGSIDLFGVTGVSSVTTVNGRIRSLLNAPSSGPMSFETTNGSIDLTVKPDFNAALDATAAHGSVKIDDQFGITVDKQFIGQEAHGSIGSGGPPLKLSTVNGSIKLTKQQ